MSAQQELKEARKMLRKILRAFAHRPSKDVRWWLLNPNYDRVDVYEVAALAYPKRKKP